MTFFINNPLKEFSNIIDKLNNFIKWQYNHNIEYIKTEEIIDLKSYIQNNNNIFLKMTIEGFEFNWMDYINENELNKFSQIVIEMRCSFDNYCFKM